MQLVDVILPIYKPDGNVFKAIESVIKQTYKNWHLYVIDDASGDDSLEKIKEKYKDYSDKITYIQLKENKRQAYARNFAIKRGNGKYIAFIDQDDVWVPHKLEWQVKYIEKHNVDAVHGNLMMINNNDEVVYKEKWEKENEGRRLVPWEQLSNEGLAKRIFQKPNIRMISSMVTRDIFEKIGGFKDQFFGGEDETFWFEIAYYAKIGYLDKILFYRREHDNNAFNVYKVERYIGYLRAIKYLKHNYQEIISNIYELREMGLYNSLIKTLYYDKSYLSSFKYFIVVFIKYPYKTIKRIIKKFGIIENNIATNKTINL